MITDTVMIMNIMDRSHDLFFRLRKTKYHKRDKNAKINASDHMEHGD